VDRGRRRARQLHVQLGSELRECRVEAGLSQAAVARAVGVDASLVGKIERAGVAGVSVGRLAELFAVVGQDLAVRTYPFGPPLRDAAHVALLRRTRHRIGDAWRWRLEVPLGLPGDARAWDAVLELNDHWVGVEAETRLHDLQALLRRLETKARDCGSADVILVLADTRHNRAAVAAAGTLLRAAFPTAPAGAWAALRRGESPGKALLFA